MVKNNIVENDKKGQFGYSLQIPFWRNSEEVPIFTKYIVTQGKVNVNRIFPFFDMFVPFFYRRFFPAEAEAEALSPFRSLRRVRASQKIFRFDIDFFLSIV